MTAGIFRKSGSQRPMRNSRGSELCLCVRKCHTLAFHFADNNGCLAVLLICSDHRPRLPISFLSKAFRTFWLAYPRPALLGCICDGDTSRGLPFSHICLGRVQEATRAYVALRCVPAPLHYRNELHGRSPAPGRDRLLGVGSRDQHCRNDSCRRYFRRRDSSRRCEDGTTDPIKVFHTTRCDTSRDIARFHRAACGSLPTKRKCRTMGRIETKKERPVLARSDFQRCICFFL